MASYHRRSALLSLPRVVVDCGFCARTYRPIPPLKHEFSLGDGTGGWLRVHNTLEEGIGSGCALEEGTGGNVLCKGLVFCEWS